MSKDDKNFISKFVLVWLFLISLFTFKVPARSLDQSLAQDKEKRDEGRAQVIFPFQNSGDNQDEIKKAEDLRSGVFLSADFKAKSIFVSDLSGKKVIFEKDSMAKRPLASVTKLLTALLAKERVPDNFFIPISKRAIFEDNDDGFIAGDRFRRDDLISYMLVASSNDAAYALAEYVSDPVGDAGVGVSGFVSLMNERGLELGMFNSDFSNPNGLDMNLGDLGKFSGADGSAFDVGLLFSYIYERYPDLLSSTRDRQIVIRSDTGRKISGFNTNRALGSIPQLIGAKTGYTDLAGGNLAFIFDAGFGRPVLVVILGSTEEGRFEDAKKITDAILKYYQSEVAKVENGN